MTPNQEENVKAWVEALESGCYRQAYACLRDNDARHCCLGVACDVSVLGSWSPKVTGAYLIEGVNELGLMPSTVRDHYGLISKSGSFRWSTLPKAMQDEIEAAAKAATGVAKVKGTGICDLVALNDAGVPFALIAKVIRARPEGLFQE